MGVAMLVGECGGLREVQMRMREDSKRSVWDWDRLQVVNLRGTAKVFPLDEDLEVQTLANLADHLSPKVYAISVDDDGLLTGASTDLEDDRSLFIAYLPLSMCPSLASCRTVLYSQLKEIDRIGPGVDLLSYKDESGVSQKVAFKFNPLQKRMRLQMAWDELHLLKSLPPHPNIVPFDCVVLDDGDVVPRVLGFTTKYIPGGTLKDPNVPFRFQWLQQLTQLVDFLNLELGIMHQDIAPRNLLFDLEANRILLFDFDRAAIGRKYLSQGRDDVSAVVFTLYEPITNDNHFTTIPHWERPIDLVQSMTDWIPTRKLDADVLTFRNYLSEWVATRKANGVQDMERYLNAPKRDL
ncbi:kinase-like domain-containing protein [Aspergillus californicus]